MSVWMFAALAIACAARDAAAERAITVENAGAPVDARALEAALAVRLPDGPPARRCARGAGGRRWR